MQMARVRFPDDAILICKKKNIGCQILMTLKFFLRIGALAQLVARRSHNPKVVSSILTGPMFFFSSSIELHSRHFEIKKTAIRDSIVVSISACHADDPGSIPGRGVVFLTCSCADGGLAWELHAGSKHVPV